jgi:serine/threonine-protein kinase HipA
MKMTTMAPLPDRVRELQVEIGGPVRGQLLRHSVYEFRYLGPDPAQPAVGLLMPPRQPTWQDGDLFPVMDQNLPEGDLYLRLRQWHPKQPLTAMHLLALAGSNGIGRLGFRVPDRPLPHPPPPITRETLLATRYTPAVFDELVRAYLGTGAGIAGMQPKIMVPDRATVAVPNLIVKVASEAYPGLAANEFLCLSAARRGGILTPDFDLSQDGRMLVVDRFDLEPDGRRIGFEDIASLMGLRVRDVLADRKYQGSYARVAELLKMLHLPAADLARFFEQVAFSVMVRNGDAHLKNFGVLYRDESDIRLAPMFDVVTTAIYRYTRFAGGPELEDQTMALKLFPGRHQTRGYPLADELMRFGREACGVRQPAPVLARLAQGMDETLRAARSDGRVPGATLAAMKDVWGRGMGNAVG